VGLAAVVRHRRDAGPAPDRGAGTGRRAGQLLRLEGPIAQDYSDDYGLDKSSLLGAIQAFRRQYDTVFIHLSDLTVTVAEDHQTAEAVLIAKVLATPAGSVTATEVRQERVRLYFRKTDRGWLLFRTESPELKFD